ncbi:BI1-like protein [Carex littledalei]|uniref:BI1-like protein n=1 Tax=Carex littledalei TaxID=544730 RepID=A0A833V4G6_9POAL|nr:BI1-like protein [Carex littledalei]
MYFRPPYGNGRDVGSETQEGRWVFLRKLFFSLATQVLLTVVVASFVAFLRSVANFANLAHFSVSTPDYLVLFICSVILPITVYCHLYTFYQSHPIDLSYLGVLAMAKSFLVASTSPYTQSNVNCDFAWEIIFESVILTSAVVVSLTMYTFWAKKHARNFRCMEAHFFLAGVITLVVILLIQTIFPLGRILIIICGGLAFLFFCGYIIYGTDNLIWSKKQSATGAWWCTVFHQLKKRGTNYRERKNHTPDAANMFLRSSHAFIP